jgi:polysaccharide export outer membrane protein
MKISSFVSIMSLMLASTLFMLAQDHTKVSPGNAANSAVSATETVSQDQGFQQRYPRYHLVPGDVLELTFEFSPEFNQTLTVQPDGFITLRSLGDVHVSGLTVPQVTEQLETAYSKILMKPAIAVVLKDFEKPYFTAAGQLARPGRYVLHGDTTLAEAVAMAGGFTDKSKHSQVLLFRRVSDQWTQAQVFDVKKMMKSKDLQEDVYLHPGDMIFVPQNRISKIARFIPSSGVNAYVNPAQY